MKSFQLWLAASAGLTLATSTAYAQAQPQAQVQPDRQGERWSAAKANAWYAKQRWLVGSNYAPASAINQLEMWQAASFDPERIDRELGWAQKLGMNTMRVFLHDMLWQQDAAGFKQRIDQFLTIAARHGIKPMFVLFDSCWDPNPKLGPQRPPIPGVHNSGWVQGPSRTELADPASYPRLRAYVEDIVGSFAKDDRILAWDMWNEPDNSGGGNYAPKELKNKEQLVERLLPQVFGWARGRTPTQPLTSGVWRHDDWSPGAALNPTETVQLAQSDVITFHDYSWAETFEKRAAQLAKYGRPIICTEWLARGAGSNVDTHLPIAKQRNIGMINWGFVEGKTQTIMPWDSWQRPYTMNPPTVWFHDLLRPDGTPYRAREAELFRQLTAQSSSRVVRRVK